MDAAPLPVGPDGGQVAAEQVGELGVGESLLLSAAKGVVRNRGERAARKGGLRLPEFAQLVQEPRVDLGQVEDALHRVARAERVADVEDALGVGCP